MLATFKNFKVLYNVLLAKGITARKAPRKKESSARGKSKAEEDDIEEEKSDSVVSKQHPFKVEFWALR